MEAIEIEYYECENCGIPLFVNRRVINAVIESTSNTSFILRCLKCGCFHRFNLESIKSNAPIIQAYDKKMF